MMKRQVNPSTGAKFENTVCLNIPATANDVCSRSEAHGRVFKASNASEQKLAF